MSNYPTLTDVQIDSTVRAVQFWRPENSTLTVCALQLVNGTYVIGESACVSPENFDEATGRDIAYQRAVSKIWALEGYLLKEKLYQHEKINQEFVDMVDSFDDSVVHDTKVEEGQEAA
jgi:hypothetical protein